MPRTPLRFDEFVVPAAALGALLFFVLYVPPPEPLLRCPFRWLTSLPCPLCGMTRALCALGHGDFEAAMRFHPLSPFAMLCLIAMLVWGFLRLAGSHPPKFWKASPVLPLTFTIFAVFGVLRIVGLTL